jgi:RNA polymerase sigma-70 factor (ECF subfamily)
MSGVPESNAGESNAGEDPELEALVAAARDGDRSAFEAIVKATYAGTYTLAYRLVNDEEDASDVVQETYLRAYKGLRRFRGDARFTTWLYRITANCASTQLGRQARARHEPLEQSPAPVECRPEFDPEARATIASERATVSRLIEELPPRLRAVLVLRDVYDMSHSSIAAELGISEAAAKVRLHRARRSLKERLYPAREGGEDRRRARAG